MVDWIRLVSNLLKSITKKPPRDCMLPGYTFASSVLAQLQEERPLLAHAALLHVGVADVAEAAVRAAVAALARETRLAQTTLNYLKIPEGVYCSW